MTNNRLYCMTCLRPKTGSMCCGEDHFATWSELSGFDDAEALMQHDIDASTDMGYNVGFDNIEDN